MALKSEKIKSYLPTSHKKAYKKRPQANIREGEKHKEE